MEKDIDRMDRLRRLQRMDKAKIIKMLSSKYNDYEEEHYSYFIAPAKKDNHPILQRNVFAQTTFLDKKNTREK